MTGIPVDEGSAVSRYQGKKNPESGYPHNANDYLYW